MRSACSGRLVLDYLPCAQGHAGSRLLPVTAPLRRSGVHPVATGTWKRDASRANLAGPDRVHDNSCSCSHTPSPFNATQALEIAWQP